MKPEISFEFFPPQTAEGAEKLRTTRRQLAQLKPAFFSCTFGAGGSTRDRTLETVLEIQAEGLPAAPHTLSYNAIPSGNSTQYPATRMTAAALGCPATSVA